MLEPTLLLGGRVGLVEEAFYIWMGIAVDGMGMTGDLGTGLSF